jgi:hypothetical protein
MSRRITTFDLALALAFSIVEVTRDPHIEDIELSVLYPPRVCFKCAGTTCEELIHALAWKLEQLFNKPVVLQRDARSRICLVATETRL